MPDYLSPIDLKTVSLTLVLLEHLCTYISENKTSTSISRKQKTRKILLSAPALSSTLRLSNALEPFSKIERELLNM